MRFDGKRQGLAALLAIGIAILCGVVAGLLGRGHYDGRYALPAPGREPSGTAAPPPSKPLPPVVVRPPAPAPVAAPAPPPDDAPETDDDDDSARIAAAVERATRKALDRGEPVRWHKAGESGYIVVSDPQDYPDRTCRNVFATIVRNDGETRSAPHLWCIGADDEDWQAVR